MRFHEHDFEDQEIVLDYHTYSHCTFKNCRMTVYGHGPFQLDNNQIIGCSWHFAGPAAQTLQTMTMLYHGGAKELIEQTIQNIRKGGHPDSGSK